MPVPAPPPALRPTPLRLRIGVRVGALQGHIRTHAARPKWARVSIALACASCAVTDAGAFRKRRRMTRSTWALLPRAFQKRCAVLRSLPHAHSGALNRFSTRCFYLNVFLYCTLTITCEQLIGQLRPGGRLVCPVGAAGKSQQMYAIDRDPRDTFGSTSTPRYTKRAMFGVSYVPLTDANKQTCR